MKPLVLSIAIVVGAANAYAQSPADALLRQSYELRRAGHDEDALPLLLEAFETEHSPRVAAQLGLCEQATGDFDHAAEHLREALASPNDPWVSRHLDGLSQAYTIAQSRVPVPAPQSLPPVIVHSPVIVHAPVHIRPAPRVDLTPFYVTIASGSALFAGGVSSWIARDVIVENYNDAVMRGQACDRATAATNRDVATGLAAAGISAGAIVATVGTVLLLTHGHSHVACAGPSCTVKF